MQKKSVLLVFLVIVLVTGGFWYYHGKSPAPSANPAAIQQALAQLQADLQDVTPHLIDASKTNKQTLTPQEQKIKNDVVALLSAGEPNKASFYPEVWLSGVGTRYLIISQPTPQGSSDNIFDAQTGRATPIPARARYDLSPEVTNTLLYIDDQHLYTYTIDQASYVLIPGSTLTGSQTYDSGTSTDATIAFDVTHTANTITMSVFEANKEVRKITLPLH